MLENFLRKLGVPEQIIAWIPGQKVVVGAIVWAAAFVAQQLGADLSVVGISSEDVQTFAALLGAYLWPDVHTKV